ncbi:hypothetical protein PVAND_017081 [Polypedilum vanderplanki]|uniref:Peptidase S1 domain-containing protein n=1 Tax=Polypedilum vanderplanki TaxID=319348 RepID=A0A9J6BI34_POLVA|nr:hypothetical protein PVAND_017081 [Polypedilum vanderplanki]
MKIKFIPTLAFLCILTFLTVDAQKYGKHSSCLNQRKVCERGFYFSKKDCKCHCGLKPRNCCYPQRLNKTACECQCSPEFNPSKCINWQEWDGNQCECFCPYCKDHKCPSNRVWNYEDCHCDCIDKEPKGGCINGKWNENECQCIPNPTITTTLPPSCSYGTKVYNNENAIDGIVAGSAFDGTLSYVGVTIIDGITIPGTLMLKNSISPGLKYFYKKNIVTDQKSNVFYLTNTPDCNCQFVDKNATLSADSYKVTLNNGTNTYNIGKHDEKAFNIAASAVGAIIEDTLHYFNGLNLFVSTTKDYKILICGLSFNKTTTLPSTTASVSDTSGQSIDYAKQLDDKFNEFTFFADAAKQTIIHWFYLKDSTTFLFYKIMGDIYPDPNTKEAKDKVYLQILRIYNNNNFLTNTTATFEIRKRRKRQTIDTCQNATLLVQNASDRLKNIQKYFNLIQSTMSQVYNIAMDTPEFIITAEVNDMIQQYLAYFVDLTTQVNECEKRFNELSTTKDNVCSQTSASSTTKEPIACSYSWNPYAGNSLPPNDGLYVGKNPYGNDIYVGAGTANGNLAPGSLEPKYLNGVTTESGYVVYNVTTDVTYLAIFSSCKCNWLPNVDVYSTSALVRLRDYYWIGRYTFADGSYVVGKIYDQGSGPVMSHAQSNQEIQTADAQKDLNQNCEIVDKSNGICTFIDNCPIVKEYLLSRQYSKIKICNHVQRIVCCPTPSNLETNNYKIDETTPQSFRISEKMCREYAKVLLHKVTVKSLILGEPPVEKLISRCKHESVGLIIGGAVAKESEFPHQALLGYKQGKPDEWACGGSLISPNFILTAAHCLRSPRLGEVKFIKLGMNNQTQVEGVLIYRVAQIFIHPNYNSLLSNEDIGLIKLNEAVPLSENIFPICLPTRNYDSYKAIVSGFGKTENYDQSEMLMKVTLEKFSHEECQQPYKEMVNIDRNTMLCYGHHSEIKDSCNGDSGGPLQIKNEQINCTYIQLGLVSFGLRECGFVGIPGVYVNVYNYIDWIENIVWNGTN